MEKDIKLFIFCFVLVVLGSIHYLYTSPNFSSFGFMIFPPYMLFISLVPSKKLYTTDYSSILSLIGISLLVLSYMIYFASSFGMWNIGMAEFIFLFVFVGYIFFLGWYKGRLI